MVQESYTYNDRLIGNTYISNGVILTLTQISRARYSTLNISDTIQDRNVVTTDQ